MHKLMFYIQIGHYAQKFSIQIGDIFLKKVLTLAQNRLII